MNGSRAAKIALYALCALGPAVFAIKAIVKPEGDTFPAPSKIPAVPVLLVTLGPLRPQEIDVPRAASPMPALASLLRDSARFAGGIGACDDATAARASILAASLPNRHGCTGRRTSIAQGMPTLATELKKAGFVTFAGRNTDALDGCGLDRDVDQVAAKAPPAELVAALDRFLGEKTPPRFFAWLDFDGALPDLDAGVAALLSLLDRRRIQGDCVVAVASISPPIPAGASLRERLPRIVASVRFPFEWRAATRVPAMVGAIDLAPTALEVVRAAAPPRWTGRSRVADVRALAEAAGPAVAGPFLSTVGPVWAAELGPLTLFAKSDGARVELVDRSGGVTSGVPEPLRDAILRAAAP